jgi:hypothetical protein
VIEPPIIEDFTTGHLGQGLRVLRYFAVLIFAGAGLSLALHARELGIVLLALAVLTALVGFVVAVTGFSRLKTEQAALIQDALAGRQRRAGSTAPDARE